MITFITVQCNTYFTTFYMYNINFKNEQKNGSEGRTRTCDNLINSQVLLPTELLRNNTIQFGFLKPLKYIYYYSKHYNLCNTFCENFNIFYLSIPDHYQKPNSSL